MQKEIIISIPKYDNTKGFEFSWEDNFAISIEKGDDYIRITANKAGLLSLANHLINLAQDGIKEGYHFHLDQYNSLEDGSTELIVEKM